MTSSFIECRGGSEPTPIRMKGRARGFVAHRMQCEARVVVRVFFAWASAPLYLPPRMKLPNRGEPEASGEARRDAWRDRQRRC